MKNFLADIRKALRQRYDTREIRFLAKQLLQRFCGCSDADFYAGKDINISAEQRMDLTDALHRLEAGEPIQYIVGDCEFYGHRFKVRPPVLIPRPETEELVDWVVRDFSDIQGFLLDVGTGSGCIALSLAAATSMQVEAWDILPEAIALCRENASLLQVKAEVKHRDLFEAVGVFALDSAVDVSGLHKTYDVIVSNPPYICQSQAVDMQENVLAHESHLALFVPDDDALKYYEALALLGKNTLRKGGCIYMEINELLGEATADVFRCAGYRRMELRCDLSGRDRMIKAWL